MTIGVLVSGLATVASLFAPEEHGASVVALVFLAATYLLAIENKNDQAPAHFGLSLGGLLEKTPLSPMRMGRETSKALGWALLCSLVVLPPFAWGFALWEQPIQPWQWQEALGLDETGAWGLGSVDLALGHLLVVALPEEAFFRGYLQTSLHARFHSQSWKSQMWAILATSAIFALGHVMTTPAVGRLAVFFPSLLFGLLRMRTRGIGAAVFLHAFCNIFSALLVRGYGLD